jgi:hypothetical protein
VPAQVGEFVSHPLVSGGVVSQSDQPGAHAVYVQVVPVHWAPALCAVSHVAWQAPQLAIEVSDVSQPLVLGAELLQSAQPGAHPTYVHVPLLHPGPVLCNVSQTVVQFPHVLGDDRELSHPSVSGAFVLQLAYPGAQPPYWHVVPLQLGLVLCAVSQAAPHAPQFVMLESDVSQPSVSGGVLLQSAQPDSQPA